MACSICAEGNPQAGCPAGGQTQPTPSAVPLQAPPSPTRLATGRSRIIAIETQQGRLAALRALDRPVIVALVACSKHKQTEPAPARELYTGELFKLSMSYAARAADEVYIVSAKYGLLKPNDWIGPYDLALKNLRPDDRWTWGSEVATRLEAHLPGLSLKLELLAGRDYVRPILRAVTYRPSWAVSMPLLSLGIGKQMQWLKKAEDELAKKPISVHPPITRSESSG